MTVVRARRRKPRRRFPAEVLSHDDGKYADMHALRHTCGTRLAAAGVHPKVMQRVLRHSTITLTLDRYTHAFRSDEAEAVTRLPSLNAPVELRATGTDGPLPPHSRREH